MEKSNVWGKGLGWIYYCCLNLLQRPRAEGSGDWIESVNTPVYGEIQAKKGDDNKHH